MQPEIVEEPVQMPVPEVVPEVAPEPVPAPVEDPMIIIANPMPVPDVPALPEVRATGSESSRVSSKSSSRFQTRDARMYRQMFQTQ